MTSSFELMEAMGRLGCAWLLLVLSGLFACGGWLFLAGLSLLATYATYCLSLDLFGAVAGYLVLSVYGFVAGATYFTFLVLLLLFYWRKAWLPVLTSPRVS